MVNLLLTEYCNNSCPYCFAKEKVDLGKAKDPSKEITIENVKKLIEFLKKDNHYYIGLLGGEPTLHDKFPEILELFEKENFQITVFSNGRFEEKIRNAIIKAKNTGVLFNVNEPKFYDKETYEKIVENIVTISKYKKISIGINFFYKEQDFNYILDLAKIANIERIRFDIAHPIVNEKNLTFPFEYYREIGKKIISFAENASKFGITISADCGATVWCMFDEESRKKVFSSKINRIFDTCVNGGPIDISPDLKVWRCFPLSRFLNVELPNFKSIIEIQKYFNDLYSYFFFDFYPANECYDCKYAILKKCQGSCLARTIQIFLEREKYFMEKYYRKILNENSSFYFSKREFKETNITMTNELKRFNIKIINDDDSIIESSTLITDFIHNFNPLELKLFNFSGKIIPEKIEVYAVPLTTKKNVDIPVIRKTKNINPNEFIDDPSLIYETDLKTLRWKKKILNVNEKANAIAIYYIAKFNDEFFSSLDIEGFQWILPLKERSINFEKLVRVIK